MSSRRWLLLGLLGCATALWGFGVYQLVTATPITLPHRVTWLGADGRPIVLERYHACGGMSHHRLVLGDRMILECGGWGVPNSYAWIEPRSGTAKLAWPLPAEMQSVHALGFAPREDGMFGVVFEVRVGERDHLAVALAGRDGWAVPPTIIANRLNGHDHADPYALGWVGGAVEIVVGRPVPGFGEDPFGMYRAEVVRLVPGRAPQRRLHSSPPGCDDRLFVGSRNCRILAAIPGAHGWKLITRKGERDAAGTYVEKIWVISETGEITAAPPELAFWSDNRLRVDAAALGLVEKNGIYEETPALEPDGTRRDPPAAPHAAYTLAADHSHAFIDGVLRRHVRWLNEKEGGRSVFAHLGAPIYIDVLDKIRIGTDPDRLTVVARHRDSLSDGAFLPAPGGRYWVTREGEFVTLDHELRRTDHHSLREHFRTGGSWSHELDESEHLWRAGWVVLGLPIALVVALVARWLVPPRKRAGLIAIAACGYLAITLLVLRSFLASLV